MLITIREDHWSAKHQASARIVMFGVMQRLAKKGRSDAAEVLADNKSAQVRGRWFVAALVAAGLEPEEVAREWRRVFARAEGRLEENESVVYRVKHPDDTYVVDEDGSTPSEFFIRPTPYLTGGNRSVHVIVTKTKIRRRSAPD